MCYLAPSILVLRHVCLLKYRMKRSISKHLVDETRAHSKRICQALSLWHSLALTPCVVMETFNLPFSLTMFWGESCMALNVDTEIKSPHRGPIKWLDVDCTEERYLLTGKKASTFRDGSIYIYCRPSNHKNSILSHGRSE